MIIRNSRRALAALLLSTSLTAVSAPAWAQIDEIIVTSQKKEQNLQDVSASVSAFDDVALENNRIEGLEDLSAYVPALYTYPAAANSNGVRVSLRGVGTFDPQLGLDTKVAVYTDGVYLGKTVGLAFDSPDLARVEVLKGPQGTLYGRNAVAGAINLISQAPDPTENFGKLQAEYGNYNALNLKGAYNLSLGEQAALRVSVNYGSRDGWVENLGPGNDYSGYDRLGVRAAFGFQFTDNFYAELAGDYNKSTNEPHFYQSIQETNPGALFGAAIVGATNERLEEFTAASEVGDGFAENMGVSLTTNWDFAPNHSMKTQLAWRGLDSTRYVTLNPMANTNILTGILLGDVVPDAVIGGFPFPNGDQSIANTLARLPELLARVGVTPRADYGTQIPRIPVTGLFQSPPGQQSPTVDGHSQISFETTSTGSFKDGRLEYTAGVYYYDETTGTGTSGFNGGDGQDYLDLLAAGLGIGIPGLLCHDAANGTIAPFYCSTPTGPAPNAFVAGLVADGNANALAGSLGQIRLSTGNILDIETQAYAVYGQLTFNLSDDIRLVGGLRYSKEDKSATQQNVSPFFRDTTDLLGGPILPQSGDLSFDSIDPQLKIEFDITEDFLLYGSYSQAFRSGGFNASASQVPVPPATVGGDFTFDPENITAYEAGFKGDFFDRLRLNAAIYYYDLPDQQFPVPLDQLISTRRAITNVKGHNWGIEADGILQISDAFSVNGNFSYITGEIEDLVSPNPAIGTVTRDGLQGTPEIAYNIGANYRETYSNGITGFANLTFSHKDEVETTPFLYMTDQNLLNGRMGFSTEVGGDGREVTFALWGSNLTDDKYTIDTLPFRTFANTVVVFGTPRTYGASIGLKF